MEGTMKEKKQILLCILLIGLATFVSYYPSLQNGFTNWDDNHMVTENYMIRSLSLPNLARIFTSMHYAHYHPLVVLTYSVEYRFFGLDPFIYHSTNLAIHIVNSLLAFWLVRSLRGGLIVPLVAGVLFGIHPLHVESVAWVTERKDVLYTAFYFLSLIMYVKYVRSGKTKYYVYVLLAFLCSLLSKAMAVTLPAVLVLIDYLLDRRLSKQSIIEKFPAFGLSLLFGIVMLYATYQQKSQVAAASFGLDNVLVAFHGLIFYLAKYLYPVPLSSLYPYPGRFGDPLPIEFTLSPFIVVMIVAAVVVWRKKTRMLIFLAGLFIIVLAPVLQLTRVGGVIAADRFTYVAILAPILATAEGIHWLASRQLANSLLWQRIVLVCAVLLLMGCAFLTWNRTKVWRDSITLWNDVAEQYTGLPVAYNNRGLAYADRKQFLRAIDDYNTGLSLDADDWKLRLNRGSALREIGAYKEAIADYDHCLEEFPTNSDAYYYRGLTYQYLNKADAALSDYSQALNLNPSRLEAYVNRGTIYAELKEYEKAFKDFDKALKLYPDDADTYFNRGMVFKLTSRSDEALADFNRSLSLQPQSAKTLNQRGMIYFGKGQFDRSIEDYDKALEIEPANVNLFNNRGAAYYQKRDFDKALKDYNDALSLAPNFVEALTNRAFVFCAILKFDSAEQDIKSLRKLGAWVDPRLVELTSTRKMRDSDADRDPSAK